MYAKRRVSSSVTAVMYVAANGVFNGETAVRGVRQTARDTRLLYGERACPVSEN